MKFSIGFLRNCTSRNIENTLINFNSLKKSLELPTRYTIYPVDEIVVGVNINGTWTGEIGEIVREVRVVHITN